MTAKNSDDFPPFARFQNGWYCPQCNKVSEHTFKFARQVCDICGFKLGHEVKPKEPQERKLKGQIYRLTRQLDQLSKDPKKQLWTGRIEKLLNESKDELSRIKGKPSRSSFVSHEIKFNRDKRRQA